MSKIVISYTGKRQSTFQRYLLTPTSDSRKEPSGQAKSTMIMLVPPKRNLHFNRVIYITYTETHLLTKPIFPHYIFMQQV
jgi:hypothetical protein